MGYSFIGDSNGTIVSTGIGSKYKFNKNFGITFELSYRMHNLNYEISGYDYYNAEYKELISRRITVVTFTIGLLFE